MAIARGRKGLFFVALCVVAPALAFAKSDATADTFKRSGELEKRTAKTSEAVNSYVVQLDKTEQALSGVTQAGKELKKRYESFSKSVNDLAEAEKRARSHIDEMKSSGAEYFAAWDTSIAGISDPQLKQASAERRSKIMKDHDELTASLSDVGSQLEPFMNTLQDLKSFLATDLSPENISSAGPMIQKSQADALALKGKIAGVQSTLRDFLGEAPK